jgi:type 1 glutamine amidotransferase
MRRAVTFVMVLLTLGCACAWAAAAEGPPKIKVLLITGDDVGAHKWREMSEATREVLVKAGKFDVRVCEDPNILESAAALGRYDVVLFMIYATKNTPTISDQAKENLVAFVKGGKGFYVKHLASASFGDWAEFGNLCGRHWVMGKSGHGPRSVFEAKIVGKDHAISKGLANFKIDDELYAKLQGDGPIEVLVEADSDWSKKTEPLFFVKPYGQGRVVHDAFGHDGKVMADDNVARLIARGVEWAAKGAVAD